MPWIFHPRTIRHRLLILSGIFLCIIFILVFSCISLFGIFAGKVATMEKVEDLFDNILVVRHYETSIMLRIARCSPQEVDSSFEAISRLIEELSAPADVGVRKLALCQLRKHFAVYRESFRKWCMSVSNNAVGYNWQKESRLIRLLGQRLTENASELVRINRGELSDWLRNILFLLIFLFIALFSGGTVLFFSQIKSILHRLSLVQQGTTDASVGKFKKIDLVRVGEDELSGLVNNFNKLVDVLEQKEEQLIQSKKMASIGTFSSSIAHEINNSLNNISLSADVLREDFDTMKKEEIGEVLDDIMAQTGRASRIVRNLLDFSRAAAQEWQRLSIEYVLQKTIDLIANELRIHKITLERDLAANLPQIYGDPHQLQQVFLNLIINAEQAIGDTGRILVRAREMNDGYIRVEIHDSGPGIPQEYIDRIFDPFFTTKKASQGTGLGLAIVHDIVKKHGGHIEVDSAEGKGTTFSVYLPINTDGMSKEQKEG